MIIIKCLSRFWKLLCHVISCFIIIIRTHQMKRLKINKLTQPQGFAYHGMPNSILYSKLSCNQDWHLSFTQVNSGEKAVWVKPGKRSKASLLSIDYHCFFPLNETGFTNCVKAYFTHWVKPIFHIGYIYSDID